MRCVPAPLTTAAVMNSSSRTAMNLPRTTRAMSVQPTSDRMTTMPK